MHVGIVICHILSYCMYGLWLAMSSQRSMEDLTQLSDEDETQLSSEVSLALYEDDDERQVFGVSNKMAKMTEQESQLGERITLSETEWQPNQSEQENDKNSISDVEMIESQQTTWIKKRLVYKKERFERRDYAEQLQNIVMQRKALRVPPDKEDKQNKLTSSYFSKG